MDKDIQRSFTVFADGGSEVTVQDDPDGLELFEIRQEGHRIVMNATQAQKVGKILKDMAEGDYNGPG